MEKIQFPIKYFEKNLIFTHQNEIWAYYRMDGFDYDFKDDDKKNQRFKQMKKFFHSINAQTHLLVLPKFQDIKEINNKSKSKLTGPLKEVATRHIEETEGEFINMLGNEANNYSFYIGIKLPEIRPDVNFKNFFSDFATGAKDLLAYFNLANPDISNSFIKRASSSEERINNRVSSWFNLQRLEEKEIAWLINRNLFRGMSEAESYEKFEPAYKEVKNENGDIIKEPIEYDVLRLTEGTIKDEGRTIQLNQNVKGDLQSSYMAFLPISDFPKQIWERGDEWIYLLQSLDFPVELSIRTEALSDRNVKRQLEQKKKGLKDQEQHSSKNGEAMPDTEENLELSGILDESLANEKPPLHKTSIVFCIAASNKKTLQERVQSLIDLYMDLEMKLARPYGDQFLLFTEFLPGSQRYVFDYIQMFEPRTLAAGMFGATNQIGNETGFPVATHGRLKTPVYFDAALAAKNVPGSKTRSPSAIFIGPQGGGKSFNANLILYHSVLAGGKALVIDPKSERRNWDKDLIDLQGDVNIITLSHDEENRGRLDPFVICETPRQAVTTAVKIISFLLDFSSRDIAFAKITNVAREVSESDNPCMQELINRLKTSDNDLEREKGEHLEAIQDFSFAHLLFGDGTIPNALTLDNPLNVLLVEDLQMPSKDKPIEKYDPAEQLSVAVMMALGEFSNSFIKTDNSIFKTVFFDEAWMMLKTSVGEEILDRLIREGRNRKAGIYLATHNVDDIPEKIRNLVGTRFVFQNEDTEETKKVLRFMGLSESKENIDTIKDLEPTLGECLYQDMFNRTSVIQFQCFFTDLFQAFDTRPPEFISEQENDPDEQDPVEYAKPPERKRELVHT